MAININGTNGITYPDGVVQPTAPLGVGQTWTNVTASRATGVTYTNSTGRPIFLTANYVGVGQMQVIINAVLIYSNGNSTGYNNVNCIIVPAGATYQVATASGGQSLSLWFELR
jgi:hypothetical protein